MRQKFSFLRFFLFYLKLSPSNKLEFIAWLRRSFNDPAPHFVKMKVLSTAKDVDVWIETGTYVGQTTEFLGKSGLKVISIEPSRELANAATFRLKNYSNIKIVNALSEEVLGDQINSLPTSVKHIAFWLDGHYSDGSTHLGPVETPIKRELELIESELQRFSCVTIFIDDFRCFVEGYNDYPSATYLSNWVDKNNMTWEVKHDIFIVRKS
jgi:hypothetical protein